MPTSCQKPGQASTGHSMYQFGGSWVVCTEVSVATNDHARIEWTARPHYTALEVMKLPRDERRRILEQAADDARLEYENDTSLTGFDALGETDLYDETS